VQYNINGWLDKNKDPIQECVIQLMQESKEPLVATFFKEPEEGACTTSSSLIFEILKHVDAIAKNGIHVVKTKSSQHMVNTHNAHRRQNSQTEQSYMYGCSLLFCSLAVLDLRVGHTMDVGFLSPFIPVLCHSD